VRHGTKARHKGVRGEPDFMTKSQLAYHLGELDPGTLDDWIAEGTFPPPHSRPGTRTAVWLREHYEFYKRHGYWPRESFRTPGA
jgi:hypothetical protein